MPDFIQYDEVVRSFGNSRAHLLLGNGFSIGCDPVFKYQSLYEKAVAKGLSANAQQVFKRFGTNNFEGVMSLLENTHWVAVEYSLVKGDRSQMLDDVEIVKRALIEAIADSHLDHSGLV